MTNEPTKAVFTQSNPNFAENPQKTTQVDEKTPKVVEKANAAQEVDYEATSTEGKV